MIRLATPADIFEVAKLGGVCYELEVAFGPLIGTYEVDYACEMLSPCNGPDSILVISENDGKIDGIFYAIILRNTMYQRKISIAQEIVWHTDPDLSPYKRAQIMAALLETSMWCMTVKGVVLSAVGTRLSAPVPGKILKRSGYVATGTQWHKEIQHV